MKCTRTSRQALGDLFIRPVATPDGISLGWAVCVLKQDDPTIQEGDMLILGHYTYLHDAEGPNQDLETIRRRRRNSLPRLLFRVKSGRGWHHLRRNLARFI